MKREFPEMAIEERVVVNRKFRLVEDQDTEVLVTNIEEPDTLSKHRSVACQEMASDGSIKLKHTSMENFLKRVAPWERRVAKSNRRSRKRCSRNDKSVRKGRRFNE